MELKVNNLKSNLPPNATVTLSSNPNGTETIEIAIPINADLIYLSYPRLFRTVKTVNEIWLAAFTVDFPVIEHNFGGYAFEAETFIFQRNQFKTNRS